MTNTRLSFFEETEVSYVQKPFVEKYVQSGLGDAGEEHEVISVEEAKSGTGYKLETKDFVVFLRKNSTVLGYLLEALGMWVKDSDNPALVVLLTEKTLTTGWQQTMMLREPGRREGESTLFKTSLQTPPGRLATPS